MNFNRVINLNTSTNMPDTNSINLTKLRSYVGDNTSDVEDMIQLFLQIIPKQKERLEKAFEQHNWEDLNYTSHQIKPSLDILGLQEAKEKAKIIESLSKTGNNIELLEQFVTGLCQDLNDVCNELSTIFPNLKNKP
jgi:HPt (histidine-containing phosphotransfer) domain-containing protein